MIDEYELCPRCGLPQEECEGHLSTMAILRNRVVWALTGWKRQMQLWLDDKRTPARVKKSLAQILDYCHIHGIDTPLPGDIFSVEAAVWILSNKSYTLNNALVIAAKAIARQMEIPGLWPYVYQSLITHSDPWRDKDFILNRSNPEFIAPYIQGAADYQEYQNWVKDQRSQQ